MPPPTTNPTPYTLRGALRGSCLSHPTPHPSPFLFSSSITSTNASFYPSAFLQHWCQGTRGVGSPASRRSPRHRFPTPQCDQEGHEPNAQHGAGQTVCIGRTHRAAGWGEAATPRPHSAHTLNLLHTATATGPPNTPHHHTRFTPKHSTAVRKRWQYMVGREHEMPTAGTCATHRIQNTHDHR